MTQHLLAYCPRGTEFAVETAINDMGGFAVVPRKVELIRLPKQRYPTMVEEPVMANYLFAALSPDLWHRARNELRAPDRSRLLFSTVAWIGDGEWKRIQDYAARIEQDYQLRMEQIEAGNRLSEYQPGDALQLLGGAFMDRLSVFRRIVEGGTIPLVEYEVQGAQMFGKPIILTIDPVMVRRAAE